MKQTSPLARRIADQLKAVLPGYADGNLPSIASLAREWNVSPKTMWKAVHILDGLGLLVCRKGAGISLPGHQISRRGSGASLLALHDKLRTMIIDGTYHAGETFSKITYFAIEERCSASTVIAALRRLEHEGLAHRRGKQWIVGKATTPPAPWTSVDNPVAMFVVVNEDYWKSIFSNSFTSPFISAFTGELRARRIGLSLAAIYTPTRGMATIPAGADEIRSFIRQLGNRYEGSIVTFFPHPGMPEWLARFPDLRKPLINLNLTNEPATFSRRSLRLGKGDYYYLHLDESAAIRLALGHVASRGHRNVGMPIPTAQGFEWALRRASAIQECASRFHPDMRIVTSDQSEPWWPQVEPGSSPGDFLAAAGLSAGSSPLVNELPLPPRQRDALHKRTPSLGSMMSSNNVSAVLALNNELARKYFLWFALMGTEIPRRLSLISFDDTPESVIFPITTIDFGFARLGYLAAHILIGDIPVKADREGRIPGVCELVDRGSVARAGL